MVGRVRTSCRCSPFRPSTSRLCQLAPYCFNTAATPPAALPPVLSLLLITWLNGLGSMRGWFSLSVGSSCLPPLSFPGHATPPHRLSGRLKHQLRPAIHSYKCWLGYQSPSRVCARLGFPLASASRSIRPRYIYLSCVVPSYVFVLGAPESIPLFESIVFVAGL